MGLDITWYRGLAERPDAKVDEHGEPEDYDNVTRLFANPDFPGRAEGIKDSALYGWEEAGGFRAGSYMGYNRWRNQLAILAGFTGQDDVANNYRPGPFVELLYFSDCEGVIGPVVSAKLAKDFDAFALRATAFVSDDDWFLSRYAEWRNAFHQASQNGAVDFH